MNIRASFKDVSAQNVKVPQQESVEWKSIYTFEPQLQSQFGRD